MANRIRAYRQARGLTLADLAAACDPPTTAQTIGRLETGTRGLSITWIERIAAALEVDPTTLMRTGGEESTAHVVADLTAAGPMALAAPREALLPHQLAQPPGSPAPLVMAVRESVGEYRPGDLVWLRPLDPLREAAALAQAMNRDCLAPRPGGRFAFGRLIDRQGTRVGLLPPGAGQKQVVLESPPWIAVAAMLVRAL